MSELSISQYHSSSGLSSCNVFLRIKNYDSTCCINTCPAHLPPVRRTLWCPFDWTASSAALQAGTSPNVTEGPVANLTGPLGSEDSISAPDDFPAIVAAHSLTSTTMAPAPAPAPAIGHVHEPVIILMLNDGEDSSDDEDPANAVMSLADNSTLQGRYIGVFSGWDATGPKVLGVSCAIYHKAESLELGIGIMKRTIEHGEVAQVV
ncbi:uncharacterized protein F5147DRAFT_769919 [Suillus discolor]|uniref:Uncharacterized protein n=1 Tax=Suillus discolor TaxID=1912936 RepID=A0A9P7FEN8_9AGAM|nr:uncharacterized protein F5147DRAFT_769919 [Suillus discolor]KAG2114605.1 hypothetical protein F5147DRAFT_769919 [Suillus discolor]